MKHYLIGAAAIFAIAACTTNETKADMSVADDEVMKTEAMMVAPEEEAEVCAVRDPEDGECLCRETNANGECVETGGVIIIPAPAEVPRAPTGGTVIIPDSSTPE